MVVVVVTVAPPWLRCFRVPNAIAIRCLQGLEEWLSELSYTLGIDFGSGCRVHYTRVAQGPLTFMTVPTLVCSSRDIATTPTSFVFLLAPSCQSKVDRLSD